MALIHGWEIVVIMDVLTRRLEKKWSRCTAHKPGRRGGKKHDKRKRQIFSLLIADKGKNTVSVLGHYILLPYREEEIVSSYIE